jgi:hypothetical protein
LNIQCDSNSPKLPPAIAEVFSHHSFEYPFNQHLGQLLCASHSHQSGFLVVDKQAVG